MDTTKFSKIPNIIEEQSRQDNVQIRSVIDATQPIQERKSLSNIFLDDEDEFLNIEDAEIFYPSRMNDNPSENLANNEVDTKNLGQPFLMQKSQESKPFIVANTSEIKMEHLRNDCIIPVFSKDNEKTIAHQEFIDVVYESVSKLFPFQSISEPEIRVSHQIKGRTPNAIYKNAKDLLEHEKTIYYERMAFVVKIPSIKHLVNGNEIYLCVGGVRSYNQENLYNKKALEKFKFFIGFQNFVCMNLCVSSDGFVEDLRVSNALDLQSKAMEAY